MGNRSMTARQSDDGSNVIVMGGGVGGLTAAHELRRRGFLGRITLVESLPVIGGVARSSSIRGTGTYGRADLPTEYSWRGLAFDYRAMHTLLKDIPISKIDNAFLPSDEPLDVDDTKPCTESPVSVDDRTQIYDMRFLLPGPDKMLVADWLKYMTGPQLQWSHRFYLWGKLIACLTSSRKRIRTQYTGQTWQQFLQLDPANNRYLHDMAVRAITPSLGPDAYRASASCIMEYVESTFGSNPYHMMVFDGPTSEVWFQHWHRHLVRTLNVDVLVNHRVRNVNCISGERQGPLSIQSIQSIEVETPDGDLETYTADVYINNLPPQIAMQVLPQDSGEQQGLRHLATRAQMHMPGVQFYFDEPLVHPDFPAGVFLIHTPWNLTIEPQGSTWRLSPVDDLCDASGAPQSSLSDEQKDTIKRKSWPHRRLGQKYGDGTTLDIWSVTLCDDDRPGWNGKKWRDCSEQEVIDEVWLELLRTRSFAEAVAGSVSRKPLADIRYQRAHVWQTFVDATKHMQHCIEPMISANASTWESRPETRSQFHPNMLWASAYNKNEKEMVRMDSAVQSGTMAAEAARAYLRQIKPASVADTALAARDFVAGFPSALENGPPRVLPRFLAPLRALDHILVTCMLPHPATLTGNGLVLLLLYFAALAYALITMLLLIW